MIYLITIFTVLLFLLAWRRLDWAVMLTVVALPAYLIRFNIFGLPATLLEIMIWAVFSVWLIKNFSQIKNNFLENFKKDNKKIKIRYPFDWEIVLMLLVALVAVGVAGFSAGAFGIWKAYFFEPALFFIVVFNVMKTPPAPLVRGVEVILWPLAVSALAVSALALYQKITGQLIDNTLWAAAETRRVVSFFGYPNAVGLYLGPLALVFAGWLFSVIASDRRETRVSLSARDKLRNLTYSEPNQRLLRRYAPRNDIMKVFFIFLIIILSLLSIYFAKSKGALVGVATGLIVFGLLAGRKIRWAMVAVILIMATGILIYQPARNMALENLTFKNKSGQIRMVGFEESWTMLKDGRLITGAGLANYQATVAPYHAEGFFIKNDDPDWLKKIRASAEYRKQRWQPLEIYLYPHNIILNFWSELGLAGLLLFIWIILKFFWMGISSLSLRGSASDRSNLTNEKFLTIGLLCAMVVIIIHGLVDVPYFKNDLAVMFWLLVAMTGLINESKARINI